MLHIINKSPFHSPALAECLRFAAQDDVIILIEDGVYAAIVTDYLTAPLAIYALKEDIMARGINDKVINTVKITDYAGFVDLTLMHHPIQTWS